MNSKQINFFIVPEDMPSIYDFFKSNEIVYVGQGEEPAEQAYQLKKFPFSGDLSYRQLCLSNTAFEQNIFSTNCGHKWPQSIDVGRSDLIQFSVGGFFAGHSKELHRGRFYISTGYFASNDEFVKKSAQFISWVDKTYKLFKKKFLIRDENVSRIYFSQRAIDWKNSNGVVMDRACLKMSI